MSSEYSGRGDPQITLSLLWGEVNANKPGRKPRLTTEAIAQAAMALADAGGLDKMSMRALSDALGVSTMALYRYVPGKPELLDLIIDRAYSELPQDLPSEGAWDQCLERVAREEWDLYLAHPWMLSVSTYRAPLGPNGLRKYERELHALAGSGLDDVDMDLAVTSLSNFVRGAARFAIEGLTAVQQTGQTDVQWWEANARILEKVANPGDFPLASRVGTAAGSAFAGNVRATISFELGLKCFIEGVKTLAAHHAR